MVSIHWGDVSRRHGITDHEPQAARLLVEAGADLVLGHHQHTVRGMEFIERVPVFYGLGQLACDLPRLAEDLAAETSELRYDDEDSWRALLGDYGIFPRAGYPLLPFHPDARFTVVARCDLDRTGVRSSGLYPCWIDSDGEVAPLAGTDPRTAEFFDYLQDGLAGLPEPAELRTASADGWVYWQLRRR